MASEPIFPSEQFDGDLRPDRRKNAHLNRHPRPDRRKHDPTEEERFKAGHPKPVPHGVFRSLGLGLITGAADDDPSAIGTYASAGAAIGPAFLWTAPVTFPMMFAVVYLCSKLGQVSGQGLFAVIRKHYARWILYFFLATAVVGNVIEAGADIGGMAAALNLLVPIPLAGIVVIVAAVVLALQIWASYTMIRNIFRWLALALLAYVGSAILAKPDLREVIRGTLIPRIQFNKDFLALLVAVVGTTLSAYLYSWQSNQDVEEDISMGRRRLIDRIGTTKAELRHSARDVAFGMFFSNVAMYFIVLSTAATLFKVGKTDITSAAQAAQALRPLAGHAAALLFAVGVIGVGFLAVPIMTTGAAYDVCQSFGWKHGLHFKAAEAKKFYGAIAVFTAIATCVNFFGLNPMKALVYAGIAQGFSTPFLMLMVMLITNNKRIMRQWTNRPAMNVLGWLTTLAMFAATIGLVVTFLK
ncbi:MAG TPA: Nramp family divalent metal transporter [Terriglobales bacterium]|nr:Nramp family divalent metal transporter [Terriglobales bacterium]